MIPKMKYKKKVNHQIVSQYIDLKSQLTFKLINTKHRVLSVLI
jgi:hypothetical protein